MKKLLLFTIVFILSTVSTYPQWYFQNQSPTNYRINGVELTSSTVGYAVGNQVELL